MSQNSATRSGEEPLIPVASNNEEETYAYSTTAMMTTGEAVAAAGKLSSTPDRLNNSQATLQLVDSDSPKSLKEPSPTISSSQEENLSMLSTSAGAIGAKTTAMGENSLMHHSPTQQPHHHALHPHTLHSQQMLSTKAPTGNNFFAQGENFPSNFGTSSQVQLTSTTTTTSVTQDKPERLSPLQPSLSPRSSHHASPTHGIRKPQTVSSSLRPPRRVATDSPSHSPPPPSLPPPTVAHQGSGGIGDLVQTGTGNANNFFEQRGTEENLQLKKEMGMPTMTDFLDHVVKQLPDKWRMFGLELGMRREELEFIERKEDDQSRFIEIFRKWELQHVTNQLRPFRWTTVAEVLQSLGCIEISQNIRTKFLVSLRPTFSDNSIRTRRSLSPDESYSSLPSRLNDHHSSHEPHSSFRPPLHTLSSRKTASPSVNVIPSPQMQEPQHQISAPYDNPYNPYPMQGDDYDDDDFSSLRQNPGFAPPPPLSLPPSQTPTTMLPAGGHVHLVQLNPPYYVQQYQQQPTGVYHPQMQHDMPYSLPSQTHPMSYPVPVSTHGAGVGGFGAGGGSPTNIHHLRPETASPAVVSSQFQPQMQFPSNRMVPPQQQQMMHNPIQGQLTRPELLEMRPQMRYEGPQYYSMPHSSTGMVVAQPVPVQPKPQLTGYTQVTHPVTSNESPVYQEPGVGKTSSAPVTAYSIAQESDDDKSTSSFYSAEGGPPSLPKQSKDPWVPLIQKYMQILEKKSTSLASSRESRSTTTTSTSSSSSDANSKTQLAPRGSRHVKASKDEQLLIQKELDKAYERISSLEIRVQDLTAQVSSEIPDDSELSLLSKTKLEQDFKKMRELKKKAEQQSMEAKQTAQRLITENFRVREELAQLKNEYDMLLVELRRMRRKTTEREQWRDEKVEAMRKSLREAVEMNFKDFDLSGSRGALIAEVSDYPSEDFTLELFWKIIQEEKAEFTVGQVALLGLPSSGKTTLLKSLFKKELDGKVPQPRGDPVYIEFYEIMANANPLTGDTQWKNIPGIDSAAEFLARVMAQYYYRQKRSPSFATESITASLAKLFPSMSDVAIKTTLEKLYKKVRALLQSEKKDDGMTQLALFKPLYMNIWDVGTNRCLYQQLLPVVAGHSKHLVILDVIDLERDVPTLGEAASMSFDKYKERGDDKLLMNLYNKFEYFMLMAGLKKWFNPDEAPAQEQFDVTIVATYTKQFLTEKGEDGVKMYVVNLKRQVEVWADEFRISKIINPNILTFCIDGDKALKERELSAVKKTIESLVKAHASTSPVMKSFPAKYSLLRSLFYNPNSLSVSFSQLSKLARSCGVYTEEALRECLVFFNNIGSIIFNPKMDPRKGQLHIIIDVPRIIGFLDKLFYIQHYHSNGSMSLSIEEQQSLNYYEHGLVTDIIANKVFTKNESQVVLWCLSWFKVAAEVTVNKKRLYYMPSLRNKPHISSPRQLSLYIQFDRHYVQCDQLVLFHDNLSKVFPSPENIVDFDPCDEFNITRFKYTSADDTNTSLMIEIIYHSKVIEVRVLRTGSQGEEKGVLNMKLCAKILHLCKLVYNDVCKNVQIGIEYDFCIYCPENDPDNPNPHFIKFIPSKISSSTSGTKTLTCEECKTEVPITDSRLLWITSPVEVIS